MATRKLMAAVLSLALIHANGLTLFSNDTSSSSTTVTLPFPNSTPTPTVIQETTPVYSAMPPGWENMCSARNDGASRVITCNDVNGAYKWDFNEFRNWSRVVGRKVDLEVTCLPNVEIGLPWPYRAANLRTLKIRDCRLKNWLQDSLRSEYLRSIPDELEHLELINNVLIMNLSTFFQTSSNMSEEFDCGSTNVATFIQSGARYDVIIDLELTEEMMMQDFSNILAKDETSYTCRYNNLMTYEESNRTSNSRHGLAQLLMNSRLPKLRFVNLAFNGFIRMPNELLTWGQKFPAIELLNLSHNALSRLDFQPLRYNVTGRIDMTYNNITIIQKQDLISMEILSPVVIDIRNNPIDCSCANAEFISFLRKNSPGTARLNSYYSYLWDLTCKTPLKHQGRKLTVFSYDDLCSEESDKRIFFLFIFLIPVAILLGLYFKFQLEVHVFVFTHCGWLWCCRSHEQDIYNDFDVYVSHGDNDQDTAFVLQQLRPRLEAKTPEGKMKFRLCLECRDFAVGAHIAEEIADKMSTSTNVVMVLSRDMTTDSWAEFEFQEALFRALSQRRRLLIFLQRGPLDSSRLSQALKRALNLFPVLKVGEGQFWNKLEYFLRHKSSCHVTHSCAWCPLDRYQCDRDEKIREVSALAKVSLNQSKKRGRYIATTSPPQITSPETEKDTKNAVPSTPAILSPNSLLDVLSGERTLPNAHVPPFPLSRPPSYDHCAVNVPAVEGEMTPIATEKPDDSEEINACFV